MSAAINAGYNQDLSSAVNQIISQVEYYEAILERKGLVKEKENFVIRSCAWFWTCYVQ